MNITELQPFGAVIHAKVDGASILSLEGTTVVDLLNHHQLLIFRGYAPSSDEDYVEFSRQFGPLLAWEFGEVLELKIQNNPANHIFTAGRVELHWDGAYVEKKPRYNMFQCLEASPMEEGGETLFVNTLEVLRRASDSELRSWQDLVINYETEKKAHYGGAFREPLCSLNPYSQQHVIRYIEPFNEDCEELNPVVIRVENFSPAESDRFLNEFNQRLYQDEVMYKHKWLKGDYLIADNSTLLHGRTRFSTPEATRYIKRINVL